MSVSQLTLWHTLVAHADPVQVANSSHLCGPTHIQEYVDKLEPDRYIVHTDHDNCLAIGFSIIAEQHVLFHDALKLFFLRLDVLQAL